MPTDLPRPRDRAEREKMLAAYDAGQALVVERAEVWQRARGVLNDAAAAESAVPPVSEASPEGMPELARPWRFLSDGTDSMQSFVSADEARAGCPNASDPLVRLAVAEVVSPEPEDSWELLAKDTIAWATGLLVHGSPDSVDRDTLDKVKARRARLLEARDATA